MSVPYPPQALLDETIRLRQRIHSQPELAYQETTTAQHVRNWLESCAIETHSGLGQTGVVGVLKRGVGRTIAFRADMDALPLNERTGLPYASTRPGVMHACGHDGHTAMLLGAAKWLAQSGTFTAGTLVFIFQPAEEQGAGAEAMIQAGVLKNFADIEEIYALHNWPKLELGQLGVKDQAIMAGTSTIKLTLTGQGGHAAMPDLANDTVYASAALICSLQGICSRNLSPLAAAVISITQINGGDTTNVLPQHVNLAGTIRYFDRQVLQRIKHLIDQRCQAITHAHEVEIDLDIRDDYPPTINHTTPYHNVIHAAQQAQIPITTDIVPSMGAEDFSFFLNKIPGCYAWLGNGQTSASLHNPHYDFNDQLIVNGLRFWWSLAHNSLS